MAKYKLGGYLDCKPIPGLQIASALRGDTSLPPLDTDGKTSWRVSEP